MKYVICFIGPDGTGKTTHAKWLVRELELSKMLTGYIHLLSERGSFMRTLLSLLNGCCSKILGAKKTSYVDTVMITKNTRRNIVRVLLKILVTLVDSWLTNMYTSMLKFEIIVYDRYFYDTLASTMYSKDKVIERLVRIATKLIPKPDLIILAIACPHVIVTRKKQDYELHSAELVYEAYMSFAQNINASVINTENSINDSRKKIAGSVGKLVNVQLQYLRHY